MRGVERVKIAVTGGCGQLATALHAYYPHADFLSRASVDVSNAASCRSWFQSRKYDLIIHAGAATKHDAHPAELMAVNVIGTGNVLQWARKQNARFIYTSTDYVYAGTGHHRETDGVAPRNTYAWSKLGGECVAQTYANTLIVRGSWYSTLDLKRASTDGYHSKVPVTVAAGMIAQLSASTYTGICNIGGPRRSLYELVAAEFNPKCQAIQRKDVQLPYPIPADSSLDCTRFKAWTR